MARHQLKTMESRPAHGSAGVALPIEPTQTVRRRLRNPLAVLGLCLAALPVTAAWQEGGVLDLAREKLSQWVDTRRLISEERSAWKINRELLSERVLLLQDELETVRTSVDEKRAELERTAGKFSELGADNAKLEAALAGMELEIAPLEARVRALLPRLPAPLTTDERFAAIAQRLPNEGSSQSMSLGERYLTVIGLLNELDKWNTGLHLDSEVLTLSDGTSAEVQTMYLGLAQGYYASRDGRFAGRGSGTESGWVWTPADGEASEISRAFAIQSNAEQAAFVALPIAIQ